MSFEIQWKENEKQENQNRDESKNKYLIAVTLALFITLFQFFLFKSINYFSNSSINHNLYPVLVANKNIKLGQLIAESDLKLIEMNLGESKTQFILNDEINSYIGKAAIVPLNENTPLLKNSFMSAFQKNSLPDKIPVGKRLYVLDLDFGSIGSLLRVGDKIDLIAYLDIPKFGKATENILTDVQIVGIGDQLEERGKSRHANSISFYIYPEEVKIISFMKQYAKFSVSLRNPNDSSSQSGEAMTLNKFIEDERIQKIIKNDSFQFIQGKKDHP
ncbi:Flp pilus assembly protein CpaB [Silvanigrella aquatica]|uniref:Flp pilus assembly protein CpaB n=1 Tax=Silvanigrella aquatica TaxID=1915309 RepID=A0A1L4D1K6_9BACT|nr:Flp pilus assembly protein CpaB [Silvanigrella aquatica]APJ04077.1 Flp pilus assembly protein CpaB [Silvanigrella aquatica]